MKVSFMSHNEENHILEEKWLAQKVTNEYKNSIIMRFRKWIPIAWNKMSYFTLQTEKSEVLKGVTGMQEIKLMSIIHIS